MRKILILLFVIALGNAYGQGNTLYSVLWVTPKMGKTSVFEKQWKAHHTKFHGKNDSRSVYEILSGDNAGAFVLVSGPSSFADMDKERPTDVAHNLDYDNNVISSVEKNSGSYTYRHADTLSYNGNVVADKFMTTVYNVKMGKMPDLISETRRSIKINNQIKSPASFNGYVKMWAGSHPQFVLISNLKEGFKELDSEFNPQGTKFRDAYIKEYGQEQWDKRSKMLPEITESLEVYISKFRKDLSTPR